MNTTEKCERGKKDLSLAGKKKTVSRDDRRVSRGAQAHLSGRRPELRRWFKVVFGGRGGGCRQEYR